MEYKLKRTTITIEDSSVSIKQMFQGETFLLKDIMDLQLLPSELYVQTRKNQFKIKYNDDQSAMALEIYNALSNSSVTGGNERVALFNVMYMGGHPQMSEDGKAEMDIRQNRILISTFHKTGQIEMSSIHRVHYENELQIMKRLPEERISLLNTLAVHLRSQPNIKKYYFTIDFYNKIGDKFCAVYGGKDAKEAYETVKKLIEA